ncbi:1-deoxy-D-xylulose-5-phosphate reductoisomerase [Chlamydiota bacterium]
MKKIAVLGSTGSIGKNVISVAKQFPQKISLVSLTAHVNIDLLERQIRDLSIKKVVVKNKSKATELLSRLKSSSCTVLSETQGLLEVVRDPEIDGVVSAIIGADGLVPTFEAIKNKKDVYLANKETLVIAGELIMNEVKKKKVRIFPLDSEHSAIAQCLQKNKAKDIRRILLTASGGPFWNLDRKKMGMITPEEALRHPKWKMGKKITIDSATMMNKALEVLEAKWLFDVPTEKIEVVIHPQSIIHSMVEFVDGSIIAQMSIPDMRLPIQYALLYPERRNSSVGKIDFSLINRLEFIKPDEEKFPALGLAYEVDKAGGTMAAVMNAANEVAVDRFLKREISFLEIIDIIKKVIKIHKPKKIQSIEDVMLSDNWARKEAMK